MIEVLPDVNWWLDACRYRDTLAAAVENRNGRMKVMSVISAIGAQSGVRLHTGEHVLRNVRRALAQPETSRRGVTREAWDRADIDRFVALIHSVVAATGGRGDVGTISHDAAIGQARYSGAPDGEDHQVLTMAVSSGATVLATSDGGLLEMGTYAGVEIWEADEVDAEVWANVRRIHAAREARR